MKASAANNLSVTVPVWFSCEQAHKVALARGADWLVLHDKGIVHLLSHQQVESLMPTHSHRSVLAATIADVSPSSRMHY